MMRYDNANHHRWNFSSDWHPMVVPRGSNKAGEYKAQSESGDLGSWFDTGPSYLLGRNLNDPRFVEAGHSSRFHVEPSHRSVLAGRTALLRSVCQCGFGG